MEALSRVQSRGWGADESFKNHIQAECGREPRRRTYVRPSSFVTASSPPLFVAMPLRPSLTASRAELESAWRTVALDGARTRGARWRLGRRRGQRWVRRAARRRVCRGVTRRAPGAQVHVEP